MDCRPPNINYVRGFSCFDRCPKIPNSEKKMPVGWTCTETVIPSSDFYIASFTGETNPTVQPFNSISVQNPECCAVELILDGNSISLGKNVKSWAKDFNCVITSLQIVSDCIDDVTVTVSNDICEAGTIVECVYDPTIKPPANDEASRAPCKC